jgi:hypothetical protein
MNDLQVINEILADKAVERVFEDGPAPNNIVCGSNPGMKGAKQVKCVCRAILWASPAAQAMIAKHPEAPVICVRCAKEMLETLKAQKKGN